MMKISACIITKNESDNIEKCIESCKMLAGEVIVADTGSTDDTVERAGNMGAKVCHFTWVDDFAVAKNFAIEKASGDWIFFPDADEYIEEDTARMFLQAMRQNHRNKEVEAITGYLYNIDQQTGEITRGAQITRIFKNTGKIRYSGKIHEKLVMEHRPPTHIVLEKAKIYHTGYTAAVLPQKHERNLKMLLSSERSGDIDSTGLYHIAGTLFSLERYEEAMDYIRRFEDHKDFRFLIGHFNLMPNFFCIKSWVMMKLDGRYSYDEMLSAIEEGEKHYPHDVKILEQKISLEISYGRYDEALSDYEKILTLFDKEEAGTGFSCKRDRSRMFAGMARICLMKGNKEEAFDLYTKAVTEDYTFDIALSGLLDVIRTQPAEDIIVFLSRIYDERAPEQAGFLTFVTASAYMADVFDHYFNTLQEEDTPKYKRYLVYRDLFHKKYTGAAAQAESLLKDEKNSDKIREIETLMRLCRYLQAGQIEADEHFIGVLEGLLKLDLIEEAEKALDVLAPDDGKMLIKVAELMKNVGFWDAAIDFYSMTEEISQNIPDTKEKEDILLSAEEGMAYCYYQKREFDAAKQIYRRIEKDSKVAPQFLKWIGEKIEC